MAAKKFHTFNKNKATSLIKNMLFSKDMNSKISFYCNTAIKYLKRAKADASKKKIQFVRMILP